ncbi:MAG: DUF4214 domain-containing protein [Acidimicrobiales bacterium]
MRFVRQARATLVLSVGILLLCVLTPNPSGAQVDRAPMTFEDVANIDELTSVHADLLRLYWAFFDREPDVDGALYWLEQYERCSTTIDIVGWIGASAEFRKQNYGAVDNETFVERMYANVLDRTPDDGGRAYWLGLLDRGQLSRPLTMLYFSASAEFAASHPLPSDTVPDRRCRLPKNGVSTPRTVVLRDPAPFARRRRHAHCAVGGRRVDWVSRIQQRRASPTGCGCQSVHDLSIGEPQSRQSKQRGR